MATNQTPEPYTASSLAKAANVDPSYIARLCRRGELDCHKLGPVWLIAYDTGRAWLAQRKP
jgi:hypothetical protein